MRLTTLTVFVLSLFASVLFFSCDKDTTGPGDNFTFPHPDGAEWEYINTGRKGDEESADVKVDLNGYTDHSTYGNVQNLEIWTYNDEESEWEYSRTFYMKVTDAELWYYDTDDGGSERLNLRFPLNVGDTWEYNRKEGWNATVVSYEDMTVPAGTFSCYVVEYEEDYLYYDLTYYIWYASGVGGYYGVYKTEGFSGGKKLVGYTIPSR